MTLKSRPTFTLRRANLSRKGGSPRPDQFHERTVADVMTVAVVDRFEPVEIEQKERRRAAFERRPAAERRTKVPNHSGAVGKFRQ
jgi:hypothetical protein